MSLWKSKEMCSCIAIVLLLLGGLTNAVQASECGDLSKYLNKSCGASGSDSWDPLAKLDEIGTGQANQDQSGSTSWPKVSRQYRWNQTGLDPNEASNGKMSGGSSANGSDVAVPAGQSASKPVEKTTNYVEPNRSSVFYAMMAPISNVSQFDIILDVSSGVRKFIPGAVNIDYLDFQDENGNLRPAADLARILGDAGISRNGSILIYGECTCALGPSISTYAYWIMRYLGHDPSKLRVLDGGLLDWAAANYPVANQSRSLPKANYSFEPNPELLATYEEVKGAQDVKSGQVKLVDARPLQDFINGSLSNNAMSIPFDKVILNGKLKDESDIKRIFSKFPKELPIVVYSKQGVQASVIWFSLEMMGYYAKLYTLMDWQEHKSQMTNLSN